MRTGVKLAAALVCAASMGMATPGEAAVVVQTKAFSHFHQVLATDQSAESHIAFLDASGSKATTIHFDPFDPTLGTLTDVRLALSSTQMLDAGVSVVGFGVAALDSAAYTSAVNLGGSAVGGLSSAFSLQVPEYCHTREVGFCLVQRGRDTTFGFDVAGLGLSPFLAGGVDLEAASTISLTGIPSFLGANALLTEVGVLDWTGTLSLTYAYDPAGVGTPAPVPEPTAWALMILGFGVAGTMLRSRRRRDSAA